MGLAGAAGRAWAALDGAAGRRVGARGLGGRLGRLGLRPRQDRSTAWFQLAAGLPAGQLARLPGIRVKVTAGWPDVCAGDRASYAADVAGRNTGQVPRLRETGAEIMDQLFTAT